MTEHCGVNIFWSEEDEMFVAISPELGGPKGPSALGETREEALREYEVVLSMIQEIEDEEDLKEASAALAEMKASGEQPIPWVDIKAELGL